MITNQEMKENRYRIAMLNKRLYNGIAEEIANGLAIQVTTYGKSFVYTKLEQFKLGKTGVYAQRGKSWDCINYAKVRSIRI